MINSDYFMKVPSGSTDRSGLINRQCKACGAAGLLEWFLSWFQVRRWANRSPLPVTEHRAVAEHGLGPLTLDKINKYLNSKHSPTIKYIGKRETWLVNMIDVLKNLDETCFVDTEGDSFDLTIVNGDTLEKERSMLFQKTIPGGYIIMCNTVYKDPQALIARMRGEQFHHLFSSPAVIFFGLPLEDNWLPAWISTRRPDESENWREKTVLVGQKHKYQSASLSEIQETELSCI